VILLLIILLVVLASIAWPWSAVLIVVGCVLEAFEIMFLRRWAKRLDRRTTKTTGAEAMIGQTAEVVQDCRPTGMVQLGGELWEARCEEGADAGDTVRVESLDGLTLVVAPRPG
jgi:membrane protein implicated in regulation of membrane protease activity